MLTTFIHSKLLVCFNSIYVIVCLSRTLSEYSHLMSCDCQVLPEYLSRLLTSQWRGSLPSPPCDLEGEEEQVLFVSALEVLLQNKYVWGYVGVA